MLHAQYLRVAWWFKHCGPGSPLSTAILMLNLKMGCVDTGKKQSRQSSRLIVQKAGEMIFKVDGSSRCNPGPVGIGGILRNHKGDTLCMFSESSGWGLASMAEVFAVLKACHLSESGSYTSYNQIFIECDSKEVVDWVNGVSGVGNMQLMGAVLDIREVLARCGQRVVVRHVAWHRNIAADFLAKLGAISGLNQLFELHNQRSIHFYLNLSLSLSVVSKRHQKCLRILFILLNKITVAFLEKAKDICATRVIKAEMVTEAIAALEKSRGLNPNL
ncbi:hypothetical protein Q3G72_027313 [Acer saccharum]|nr:hypothetical protein Q3G72_027313 [Acer saccharum]